MNLIEQMNDKALALGVPLSAHFDVTYRCNERCVHCYLDHDDHGEMTTDEIKSVLDQLAEAGTFFLSLSGGEVFMRRDFLDIVAHARRLLFNLKVKTNAVMIREPEAQKLRALGVEQIQISIYSHRPEVHDAITKLPGSLKRTLQAVRFLKAQGLKVSVANVLMTENLSDHKGVQALAREMGVQYQIDPTVTPKMDGDHSILNLRIPGTILPEVFHDETLVGNVEEFCAPPQAPGEDVMDGLPCSAGHTALYISPYGDVYPCVQFPLSCGNVRQQRLIDIWKNSPEFHQVRSIRGRDLHTCSGCGHVGSCTRCPGLAFMEGDMRGPSTADCEKSFYRTGIPSANMKKNGWTVPPSHAQVQPTLVQIHPLRVERAAAKELATF
jgi:AdoMet-dependent heme synthase